MRRWTQAGGAVLAVCCVGLAVAGVLPPAYPPKSLNVKMENVDVLEDTFGLAADNHALQQALAVAKQEQARLETELRSLTPVSSANVEPTREERVRAAIAAEEAAATARRAASTNGDAASAPAVNLAEDHAARAPRQKPTAATASAKTASVPPPYPTQDLNVKMKKVDALSETFALTSENHALEAAVAQANDALVQAQTELAAAAAADSAQHAPDPSREDRVRAAIAAEEAAILNGASHPPTATTAAPAAPAAPASPAAADGTAEATGPAAAATAVAPAAAAGVVQTAALQSEASAECCPGCCIDLPGQGKVRGIKEVMARVDGSTVAVNKFKGIPYAEPPVKNLRFAPPVKHSTPWPGTLVASDFGPGCPISGDCVLPEPACAEETDEDCLTLNVYASHDDDAHTDPLPVMVFIHGGAYDQGSASAVVLDGSHIASEGVVVVTFNYRLGALGFLAASGKATTNGALTGNYGIMDQRLLLQWVNRNIALFGGDPNRITVAGQSAGAYSILLHLTNQKKPTFQRAMILSPYSVPMRARSSGASYVTTRTFAETTGCLTVKQDTDTNGDGEVDLFEQIDVKCLRGVSLQGIINAQSKTQGAVFEIKEMSRHMQQWDTPSISEKPLGLARFYPYATQAFLPFGPVVDGGIVPNQLMPLLQAGKWHRMPVMMGNTRNEGCQYAYALFSPGMTSPEFHLFVNMIFSRADRSTLDRIVRQSRWKPEDDFMLEGDGVNLEALSNLITDLMFRCPISNITRGNDWKQPDTYLYTYNNTLVLANGDREEWGLTTECEGYVPHGSDVPAFFNAFRANTKGQKKFEWHINDKERTLFHHMLQYWVNFIRSGNPNGAEADQDAELPQWTAASGGASNGVNRMSLQTDNDGGSKSGMFNEGTNGCEIFDEAGYYF